ncbi:hypothetical protein [Kitasatospora sp. NPDC087315]|uniref:hypothetical protein n=1 Tax=Kitasatospora sp. NPDC087315 TaxID=3364069 RepID=UPI003820FBC8
MNQHTEPTVPQEQPSVSVRESARRRVRTLTAPGGWLDRRRRELAAGLDDFSGAAAYKHTREQALSLAHRVAEYEAINHQVLLGVIADPLGHAIRTRQYTITCPRCQTPGAEEYGEPAQNSDDYADCARCRSCGLEWALDPGADTSCTTCGGSGIPGAGPIGRRTPDGWEPASNCECHESGR